MGNHKKEHVSPCNFQAFIFADYAVCQNANSSKTHDNQMGEMTTIRINKNVDYVQVSVKCQVPSSKPWTQFI